MIEKQKITDNPDQFTKIKCAGWKMDGVDPVDPCEYVERGIWVDVGHGTKHQLSICEKCGFPSVGWVELGEEPAKFNEEGELTNNNE